MGVSKIVKFWDENLPNNLDPKNKNSNFMHMISSVAKAVVAWDASTTTNECRQAMAGFGYSLYNGLNDILAIADLN